MKVILSHTILRVRESLNNVYIGFSNHLQVNWRDRTQNKRLLGMKGWNYPLQLVFHICVSFALEHFERIIKSRGNWRFGFGYILSCENSTTSHECRIPISRAMISATQVLCRRPSIPMTSDPDHSKKNTERVVSQVSLEVSSTGRIEQGKCMVFLELFPAENFSDCCIR